MYIPKFAFLPVKYHDRIRKRISTAKPIHVRRVEKALDMKMFLNSLENHQQISSSDSDDEDIPDLNDVNIDSILRGLSKDFTFRSLSKMFQMESHIHLKIILILKVFHHVENG